MKDEIKILKDKMKNVPFGNSQFQIINFIANQETPERAYRCVLLQLNQKLNAMQECNFRRKRKEIDIKEMKGKLSDLTSFALERLELDIEEAELQLEDEIQFIEDCAIEIKTYESILEKLPIFTRENFEKGERVYWEMRLLKDARQEIISTGTASVGTMKSLSQMGLNMVRKKNEGTGEMELAIQGKIESKNIFDENKKEVQKDDNKAIETH